MTTDPGQWCKLHDKHQDDPLHRYDYWACERHMREATHDEARFYSPEYAAALQVYGYTACMVEGCRRPMMAYMSHGMCEKHAEEQLIPPHIKVIAKALDWGEGNHPRYNAAVLDDAHKVWAALMEFGFVEDRVDIGASGYCEALVLFFKHHDPKPGTCPECNGANPDCYVKRGVVWDEGINPCAGPMLPW